MDTSLPSMMDVARLGPGWRLLGFDAAFEGGEVGRHLFLGLVAGQERQEDLADAVPCEADRDGQPGRAAGQGLT